LPACGLLRQRGRKGRPGNKEEKVQISTHISRLVKALALSAVVAGAVVSAGQAGVAGRPPDIRDAAAVASSSAVVPDVLERYAAAHPYGGTRSPAQLIASHFRHEDAVYGAQGPTSGLLNSVTLGSDGFHWSDWAVGIGTGIGIVLLAAAGLAGARQRRQPAPAA
jgi:hypothetical protein